jgi:hypothetical protein
LRAFCWNRNVAWISWGYGWVLCKAASDLNYLLFLRLMWLASAAVGTVILTDMWALKDADGLILVSDLRREWWSETCLRTHKQFLCFLFGWCCCSVLARAFACSEPCGSLQLVWSAGDRLVPDWVDRILMWAEAVWTTAYVTWHCSLYIHNTAVWLCCSHLGYSHTIQLFQ